MVEMTRLGLIGCGAIGSSVAYAIAEGAAPGTRLVGVLDAINPEAAATLAAAVSCPVCVDLRALLDTKPAIVVEAASHDAVQAYARSVFDAGADMIAVSVGAFADTCFLESLVEHARRTGRRLLIPSGAIGGVDLIKAAAVGGLWECRLTTTKPARSLKATPNLRDRGINLNDIRRPTVVFEGTALEAIRCFPQNLNVAVTISLAGLGLERTCVRVIADPDASHNIHEVFVRGNFGEATVRLENIPSAENPRSSALACYSVLAMLHSVSRELQIGT